MKNLQQLQSDLLEVVRFVQQNSDDNNNKIQILQNNIINLDTRIQRCENMNELLLGTDLIHVSTSKYSNVGDVVLSYMVKEIIKCGMARDVEWSNVSIGAEFGLAESKASNKCRAIVVGGGGLLFDRDQSQVGSWQWNITKDAIEKLSIPIFIFAVGYNQFRNQGKMRECFAEDINALADKCGFIGLRNHGSIEAVKKYLDSKYYEKLVYQPCPTTMISKMMDMKHCDNSDFIAINMAFDRSNLRFGNDENFSKVLGETLLVLKEIGKNTKIKYYSHLPGDDLFAQYMKKENIDFEYVPIYKCKDAVHMIELYSTPKVVIGMRGHAQMIPFGCGTPIVSIISHDKMAYFLDDINHPEWGVDVLDENFGERLYEIIQYACDNEKMISSEIYRIQDTLWEISMKNVAYMEDILKK